MKISQGDQHQDYFKMLYLVKTFLDIRFKTCSMLIKNKINFKQSVEEFSQSCSFLLL
jgi:hypothetical protein